MAHYATLADYHFSADVDDIRGSKLLAANGENIGKVVDVVFDHQTGEIRYLVTDIGHDRKVLVPSNHVLRSVVDEENFETDLPAAELQKLPQFDEKMLEDEKKWREHDEEYRDAWKKHEERLEAEYKDKWHESPVQHRPGSDRNITPDEEPEAESSSPPRERIITGADLTPRRIANKFAGADPIVVPGNPDAGEITLRPTMDRGDDAAQFGSARPSRRWQTFQENIRLNLQDIRSRCGACCASGQERVA